MNEIFLKKSNELTINEKSQICKLFLEIMKKDKSIEDFDKQFLSTPFGYSYHAIMYNEENEIVAINTIIPYSYNYFGKDTFFALSVDTMTKKEYRSISLFRKLAKMVYDAAKNDGVTFVVGFPNDVSYKIFKKMLSWKDIGRLNFYFMPINIGNIKSSLKVFSFLNYLFTKIYFSLSSLVPSSKEQVKSNIYKNYNELFKAQRYSKVHSYKRIDNFDVYYKLDEYESSKVAYLIDVEPLSQNSFKKATKYLLDEYGNNIDGILYLGNSNVSLPNLIKIPLKYEPKNVYVAGLILDNTFIDDRVWNLDYWDLNLANMDVL